MATALDILTKGLLAGFAGASTFHSTLRGKFTLTSSEVSFPQKDSQYIDQWIGKRSGGGQELAKLGDDEVTRVYAGGTVSKGTLDSLGICDDDIMTYLKKTLTLFSEKTRLMAPIGPISNGDWEYRYEIVQQVPEVSLTIGKETILYKQTPVFTHVFLITDVI